MKSRLSIIFPFLLHTDHTSFNSKRNTALKLFTSLLVVPLFIFSACDDIPDGIVEPLRADFGVFGIEAPKQFLYSPTDSTFETKVEIANTQTVSKVICKVTTIDGSVTVHDNIEMKFKEELIPLAEQENLAVYSAEIPMSKSNPKGKYLIEYYVEDNIHQSPDNISKVGVHTFVYDNAQINYAPVLSDLSIPTAVTQGVAFNFSVKVSDQNGLSDIYLVYFKLYRPDGSLVMDTANNLDFFLMFDDGDEKHGDQTAKDGIYSLRNLFGTSSQTGTWKFEFTAIDRSSELSNTITHNMEVSASSSGD